MKSVDPGENGTLNTYTHHQNPSKSLLLPKSLQCRDPAQLSTPFGRLLQQGWGQQDTVRPHSVDLALCPPTSTPPWAARGGSPRR